MKRFQARRSSGRFTRNTTENTFGFHCIVCAECRRFNPWNVGTPRPATCHACGKPLRDVDELEAACAAYPAGWPRCACGLPVLDGHRSCGRVECPER
jgi:hypothetical protein